MPNAAKALILIAAFLAVHAAQAADPATSIEPDALDGAQLFATHCAMCHKPTEFTRQLQNEPTPVGQSRDGELPRPPRPR